MPNLKHFNFFLRDHPKIHSFKNLILLPILIKLNTVIFL
ncbi:hypothetical protein LEP1GSC097_0479 [Leptospira interrogans serovar Grippotyphosa str. UI 08368]|nr:hypothetical protein LEP1GSC097_0479 [Leptospira interrogans serovar Grippotyphosa str. UI 08368]